MQFAFISIIGHHNLIKLLRIRPRCHRKKGLCSQ